MARTFLDEPVVHVSRATNGKLVALEDRCCHRGMPLSHGEVFDNDIRCEYHGMMFDGSGRCVEIPEPDAHSGEVRRCAAFPIEERDDLVWIWMGDPAKADPDEIVPWPCHGTWPYKAKSEVGCPAIT